MANLCFPEALNKAMTVALAAVAVALAALQPCVLRRTLEAATV